MANDRSGFIRPGRPSTWLWLLWLSYFGLSVSGFMRMVKAIRDWYWLNLAEISPGPLYILITGALWGTLFAAALLWMAFNRPWNRLAGLAAALLFALMYWADQLVFTNWAASSSNWPFAALLTLLCLAYVFFTLRPVAELRALLRR